MWSNELTDKVLLEGQLSEMWEYDTDLLWVYYVRSGVSLDIGWSQQGKKTRGRFVVCLFQDAKRDGTWGAPLFERSAFTLQGLKKVVKAAVNLAEGIEQKLSERVR